MAAGAFALGFPLGKADRAEENPRPPHVVSLVVGEPVATWTDGAADGRREFRELKLARVVRPSVPGPAAGAEERGQTWNVLLGSSEDLVQLVLVAR